ncbi:hypothetical protein Y032_0012g1718 [Ancylostoma ceylanicum]|uniref:Uncharacterized protein n=1 Tax=Ancylostoma ceylanicum TaxID=53326 RepID=A0A016VD05_9BILA|nr:hypothetical protein Y032_0012g1718 [Ancylostoma ceylanicum]
MIVFAPPFEYVRKPMNKCLLLPLILTICPRFSVARCLAFSPQTARLNFRGGDVEYILRTQSNGWKVLEELHNTKLHLEYVEKH